MPTSLLRPALLVLGFSASLAVSACSEAEDEQNDGCGTNEIDCECNGGECPGELVCVDGICQDVCTPGELDCRCDGGECVGELVCADNLCTEPAGDSGTGTGDTTTGDTGTGDTTTG